MADLDLDTLQRLCDAAAPGPWTLHDVNEGTGTPPSWHIANDAYHNPSDDGAEAFGTFLDFGYREDAEFIAAARTALPALIAEVRRLRTETEAHEGELGDMRASLSATEAALDDAQDRDVAKERIHPVLHDLDVRIPNLAGDCHCNLVAEVVLDALLGTAKEANRG